MDKEGNKKKWIIIIILFILLLIALFLFFKFGISKKYMITLDTGGGTEIASIEIKNGEFIKLPEEPIKDGYKFSAWVNENNNVVTKHTKITKENDLKILKKLKDDLIKEKEIIAKLEKNSQEKERL